MRRAALLGCLLLLAACGFQLQGRQALPPTLATLELDVADEQSDFTVALVRALKSSGVKLVDKAAPNGAVVRISRDEVQESVLSVDARNIPTDYDLVYEVEVGVRADGQVLMQPEPFSVSRIYSFDETKLLAKQREKGVLREALARDLASVVVRRLSSL
jgi:LPS-assembly lipoprotein